MLKKVESHPNETAIGSETLAITEQQANEEHANFAPSCQGLRDAKLERKVQERYEKFAEKPTEFGFKEVNKASLICGRSKPKQEDCDLFDMSLSPKTLKTRSSRFSSNYSELSNF